MSKILVRDIQDDDMPEVSSWFATRKWPKIKQASLPPTGYVAFDGGNNKLLAVTWLYITNSSLALLEWHATAPDAGVKGLRGIQKIIQHVKDVSDGKTTTIIDICSNDKLSAMITNKCGFRNSGKENVLIWNRR